LRGCQPFNVALLAQLEHFYDAVAEESVTQDAIDVLTYVLIYGLTGSGQVLAFSTEACEEPCHYRKILEGLVFGIRTGLSLADTQKPDL